MEDVRVEEWEELSQKVIKKLYKSLPQRMAAVIKCKRGRTKYQTIIKLVSNHCHEKNVLSF